LTSVTDPANNVTTHNHDTENNLVSITDANNHTINFQYNSAFVSSRPEPCARNPS
jgi:uncharacterized protein RhaS with RHS repeats